MSYSVNSGDSAGGDSKSQNADGSTGNEKLMVALRIRPLGQEEKSRGIKCVAEKVDDKMVVLMDGGTGGASNIHGRQPDPLRKRRSNERHYVFDVAFGADSTQEDVYLKTTKPLVDSVLQGFNATVFAYGATGSGKTYTMVGQPNNPGCMARALNDLFAAMDTESNRSENIFKVTLSYLEIYNENIRDLLNPSSGNLELRDQDAHGKNIHVAGLSEVATKSTEEVMRLLQRGNRERTQEPTAANKTSSRSHALLMINVRQTAKSRAQARGAVKCGRLYMIDLAGSERASQTENRGKRLKEGAHINRSLLALGNVINALASQQKSRHVTFRDSKLTRLLKDALSGNCHTVMIAHVSPADRQRDESRNTLVYADRAKNISNKVRKNVLDVQYHVSQYQNIISELRGEIGRLKEKMIVDESTLGKNGKGPRNGKEELKDLREEMVANFKEQMKLRHRLMEIENHILSLTMEFEKQNIIISEWEAEKAKNAGDRKWHRKQQRKQEGTTTKKNRMKRKKKKDTDGKPLSAGSTNSNLLESSNGDQIENTLENHDVPKIVIQPSLSDNDEENEVNNENDENVVSNGQRKDNEEESGFEDEIDDSNDGSSGDEDEISEDIEEPDEVKHAWDELAILQREQQRYSDIKLDLYQDLEDYRKRQKHLEDELPKRISTAEEAEILTLLCKVHELEIGKVEMQSEALLKEHEVRRRDLLILKYDKQRTLCDEIIQRQRALIEAMESNKNEAGKSNEGSAMPMPPELMELYTLYQQELETSSKNEKETKLISDLNIMMRTPSMISLRGPEFEERRSSIDRLPPIVQEPEPDRLFESRHDPEDYDGYENPHNDDRISIRSPNSGETGSAGSLPSTNIPSLPPIDGGNRINRRSVSYENAKFDEDQPEYGSLVSDSEITHPYATVRRTGSKIPRPFDKQQNSTNFKSLNRNRKSNGMYSDAHARNYSAPGARSRRERQSISEFPSSRINPGRGSPKKAKAKTKERKRKNTDPFQNFGMPLERF